MTKHTIKDVAHIIDANQTHEVIRIVEEYLNTGKLPAFDPCMSCEPAHARKLIAQVQNAERRGEWPPKPKAEPKTTKATKED